MKNADLRPIVDAIRYQLDRAEKLHPEFAKSPDEMITVITEEIGEAAAEVLALKKAQKPELKEEAKNRLYEELSHIAVTAIRGMDYIQKM